MNFDDKITAIRFIRPAAEFNLRGEVIEWLDESQDQPTEAEIEAGWVAYEAEQQVEAELKAIQKAALLERLGITGDEAKLLLS